MAAHSSSCKTTGTDEIIVLSSDDEGESKDKKSVEELFQKFVSLIGVLVDKNVIVLLRQKFRNLDSSLLSESFVCMLESKLQPGVVSKDNAYKHVAEVCKFLIKDNGKTTVPKKPENNAGQQHRKTETKHVLASDTCSSAQPGTQTTNPTKCSKRVPSNDDDDDDFELKGKAKKTKEWNGKSKLNLLNEQGSTKNKMAASTSQADESIHNKMELKHNRIMSPRKKKQLVSKLQDKLKYISDEINMLDRAELSLDEMNMSDSTYIKESNLKKNFNRVWTKICKIQGKAPNTGRVVEQQVKAKTTGYAALDSAVQKYLKKLTSFPDLFDVKGVIQKACIKHNISLRPQVLQEIATDVFTDIGNKLQERRKKDHEYNFGSKLIDLMKNEEDPAAFDPELQKKLENNSKIAKKNIQGIFSKYTHLQRKQIIGSEGKYDKKKKRKETSDHDGGFESESCFDDSFSSENEESDHVMEENDDIFGTACSSYITDRTRTVSEVESIDSDRCTNSMDNEQSPKATTGISQRPHSSEKESLPHSSCKNTTSSNPSSTALSAAIQASTTWKIPMKSSTNRKLFDEHSSIEISKEVSKSSSTPRRIEVIASNPVALHVDLSGVPQNTNECRAPQSIPDVKVPLSDVSQVPLNCSDYKVSQSIEDEKVLKSSNDIELSQTPVVDKVPLIDGSDVSQNLHKRIPQNKDNNTISPNMDNMKTPEIGCDNEVNSISLISQTMSGNTDQQDTSSSKVSKDMASSKFLQNASLDIPNFSESVTGINVPQDTDSRKVILPTDDNTKRDVSDILQNCSDAVMVNKDSSEDPCSVNDIKSNQKVSMSTEKGGGNDHRRSSVWKTRGGKSAKPSDNPHSLWKTVGGKVSPLKMKSTLSSTSEKAHGHMEAITSNCMQSKTVVDNLITNDSPFRTVSGNDMNVTDDNAECNRKTAPVEDDEQSPDVMRKDIINGSNNVTKLDNTSNVICIYDDSDELMLTDNQIQKDNADKLKFDCSKSLLLRKAILSKVCGIKIHMKDVQPLDQKGKSPAKSKNIDLFNLSDNSIDEQKKEEKSKSEKQLLDIIDKIKLQKEQTNGRKGSTELSKEGISHVKDVCLSGEIINVDLMDQREEHIPDIHSKSVHEIKGVASSPFKNTNSPQRIDPNISTNMSKIKPFPSYQHMVDSQKKHAQNVSDKNVQSQRVVVENNTQKGIEDCHLVQNSSCPSNLNGNASVYNSEKNCSASSDLKSMVQNKTTDQMLQRQSVQGTQNVPEESLPVPDKIIQNKKSLHLDSQTQIILETHQSPEMKIYFKQTEQTGRFLDEGSLQRAQGLPRAASSSVQRQSFQSTKGGMECSRMLDRKISDLKNSYSSPLKYFREKRPAAESVEPSSKRLKLDSLSNGRPSNNPALIKELVETSQSAKQQDLKKRDEPDCIILSDSDED